MDKKIGKGLEVTFKFIKKYRKQFIIVLILSAGAIGGWYYLNQDDDSETETTVKQTQYEETKVRKQDIKMAIEAEGQVEAETVSVDFKQSGEIEEIYVSLGDHVDAGTELGKIDDSELTTKYKEALYAYSDAIDERDSARNDEAEETAQQKVNTTYLEYESAKEDLAEATLTSPVAGEIVEINGEVGDSSGASGSSESGGGFVVIKKDVAGPKLILSLDETEVVNVSKDMVVYATFENVTDPIPGKVVYVSPLATQDQSGWSTYEVTVRLDQNDESILDGSYADIEFVTKEVLDVLAIPTDAVDRVDGKSYVTVIKDGSEEEREVTLGFTNGTLVEVTEGLTEGETVKAIAK